MMTEPLYIVRTPEPVHFRPANPSGIWPMEYKVVVRPKEVAAKIGSIHIPETTQERDRYATQEGTIVAIAEKAFSEPDIWGSNLPKIGSDVLFSKYAGLLRKGKDGKDYRVLVDKDIAAILE